jgi:hypothetical protein
VHLLLPPLDVGVVFCYVADANGGSQQHPAATLKAVLAKTLVTYYPLARVVVANAEGEPEPWTDPALGQLGPWP